jgi:hypothetical protein
MPGCGYLKIAKPYWLVGSKANCVENNITFRKWKPMKTQDTTSPH